MVERLLTPEEAANQLGIAPGQSGNGCSRGKLPGVKRLSAVARKRDGFTGVYCQKRYLSLIYL
jgi:hypothetical protein